MIQSLHKIVHGVKMHYLTEGKGKPVLFLHGLPASSHMWKKIIPVVAARGYCCIAPDFVGMGESEKPENIEYTLDNHVLYLEEFIKEMGLTDITLVMYGFGSMIGLAYAAKHPAEISRIAFSESYLRIKKNYQDVPMIFQAFKASLQEDPDELKRMILDENYIVEHILPETRQNKMPPDEIEYYKKMYSSRIAREVLWRGLMDIPYVNPNSAAIPTIQQYSQWLQKTPMAKLLLYTTPGFLGTKQTLSWITKHALHLMTINVGKGTGFSPEIFPLEFAGALSVWIEFLNLGK